MWEPEKYFDLGQTEHHALFEGVERVWEAVSRIANYLQFRLKPELQGRMIGKPFISENVYLGPGSVVEPGAYIAGPAWIGADCRIRHGAYIRENVIVGDGVVLGNSCEFKNCLVFNGAQIPHFSYVGDSIIGHKAHLGAGVILSNLRLDQQPVRVRHEGGRADTGMIKLGAIIGDRAEIGCNSVLNPGSVIGPRAIIHPGTVWTGHLAADGVGRNRTVGA